MEKAMYPSKVIRITQIHGEGTHKRNYAVDEAGIDGGISNLIAPFTGVIKKIYTSDANEVWLESVEPVEYPDGTIDYMTIMFAHDNDVSNLKVGQVIPKGTEFYSEGTKGQAYGNHVHFECGKGKFSGTGWHNDNGSWDINNGKLATECLWIDDTYQIIQTRGYTFRNVKEVEKKRVGTPVARNESVDQVEVFETTTILNARKTPNGEILGYINTGIYNLLERATEAGYEWFRVEKDIWFAYSKEWVEVLPKKEVPVEVPKPIKPSEPTIEELQKEIDNLKVENTKLKEQLKNQPKKIFTATKTANYKIKLFENEELYIKKLG